MHSDQGVGVRAQAEFPPREQATQREKAMMILRLIRRLVLPAALGMTWLMNATAAPVTYVQDTFIGAPGSASQLVYSASYGAVALRTNSTLRVMDTVSGVVKTFTPNGQFTDISLSPDGRYLYAADYATSGGRVGRVDLQSGTYESKPVSAIPYRIEATAADKFILASQDQWISLWVAGWGTGSSIAILNSNPGGYYASAYYGDIEYDRFAGRMIHGNSNLSSHEIKAFGLVGNNFVGAESSGTYGSADAYGGSAVLATDASRFYYGRLQVLGSDVRQNQLVFPTTIVAATGADAFASGGTYYDAATATSLGSLGYPITAYGLNANGEDFWGYDGSAGLLRHFVPSGTPPGPASARADFASVAQGYPANIDVVANDTGFGDEVTVEIVTPPTHGTLTVSGSPGSKAGISVRYVASSGYTGPDAFVYSVSDGVSADSASVSVDVLAAKAMNDSYTVLANSYSSLYVAKNDLGFGSQLTVSIASQPSQGYLSVSGSPGSRNAVRIDYNTQYGATAPYTDSFSYTVSDGVHTDTALVTVRVVAYAALDDDLIVAAGQPGSVNVVTNDLGFGYARTVGVFTTPLHGAVSVAGDTITYTPAAGYTGPDSLEYYVDDGVHVGKAKVAVNVIVDADGDKIADEVDNCLGQANGDQRDSDGDGYGNWCDADLNNDSRVNFADLALFRGQFGTANPDADFDGNGIVNFADLARFKALFGTAPGPSSSQHP